MIRNVDDVTALLNRRFGSAAGRPFSIVRTLVWVLVGLYLLGMLYPAKTIKYTDTYYNQHLKNPNVIDQLLDKNDPRGFLKGKKDPNAFTIAWIGTSTLQNVGTGHYSFVPADVRKLVPQINGKSVHVQLYLLEGGRQYDLYTVLSKAIATKPDLIMLDLNPFWVFNDTQVQEWPNLNGAVFGDMVGQPASWPYLAAFDTPSDLALAVGSSHLSVLRDRWSYAGSLRAKVAKLDPLNPPKPDPHPKPLTGTARIAAMQSPLDFWETFRPIVPKGSPNDLLQQQLLKNSTTDGSAINDGIVSAMFSAIVDSKIPTVAYVPAIDPSALTKPSVNAALARIEAHLQKIGDEHTASTFLLKSQSAIRTVHGLTFKDMAHMTYDAPMVDYLANLVCTEVLSQDPTGQCTPSRSGS